ncbi:MAG: plasmid pRiA4b ORF-3 family protein [Caldilineaceae bacterium]
MRNTQIDEHTPGSILHDFAAFLACIGEAGIPLTATHLLPLKVLSPLNQRLTAPLNLALQRPSLKSYPPLEGLFLLARASGLTDVDVTGKTPHLLLDTEVHASWQALNATEQYFTLLETWVLRGRPDILGENGNLFDFAGPLHAWQQFFAQVPEQGRTVMRGTEEERSLRYFPGLRNLALLQLFGLALVHQAPPMAGQGWQIAAIERTPLGDAVLQLLVQHLAHLLDETTLLPPPGLLALGELQPTFQPYFPAWQQNLVIPGVGFQDGVYVFQVALDKQIWRSIAIPATLTLDDLCGAILDAYEFDRVHLYEFIYRSRFGLDERIQNPDYAEGLNTSDVRVGDLPLPVGASMTFHYDFLDDWLFTVLLERIDPPDAVATQPILLEKQGAAPEQYA